MAEPLEIGDQVCVASRVVSRYDGMRGHVLGGIDLVNRTCLVDLNGGPTLTMDWRDLDRATDGDGMDHLNAEPTPEDVVARCLDLAKRLRMFSGNGSVGGLQRDAEAVETLVKMFREYLAASD